MDDRYGGFDLDSFGGNAYKTTAATIMQHQQQHQQRYNNGRGPTMDNYDPNRMVNVGMATYNPMGSGTVSRSIGNTHRTLLPASLGTQPSTVNGLQLQLQQQQQQQQQQQRQQQQMRGIADFDPIPLSTNASLRSPRPNGLLSPSHHQQQQQQHSSNVSRSRPVATVAPPPADLFSGESSDFSSQKSTAAQQQQQMVVVKPPPPIREAWLEDLKLQVSGLSLEPMSGCEVLSRVETRAQQVITRYLPCVDFLVQCQQELRKGLAAATTKRLVHHMFRDAMTPRQFYNTYIANLPERFFRKNRRTMSAEDMNAAVKELQTLCANARGVERQGCEVVKNTFLGGMKDGESWGLRKWLSNHGGALHICNDSECILNSCQKLNRSLESTRKLGEKLRPLAKKALTRLKADIPASYQEHSTAHPYLPFFHRLEAALKGMSNFDPEDDDVICIDDDDEVKELMAKAPPSQKRNERSSVKRKADTTEEDSQKDTGASSGDGDTSDDDSDIIVLDSVQAPPPAKKKREADAISTTDDAEYMQALLKTFDDDASHSELFGGDPDFDSISFPVSGKKDALDLAAGLDRLAVMFDSNQATLVRPTNIAATAFWDEAKKYASALRLFCEILRAPDSLVFLERIDEQEMIQHGKPPYSNIVRHPLCFRDIVTALVEENDDMNRNPSSNDGMLPAQGLDSWNMWRGIDLLQAIDLVFLNALAYGKAIEEGKSVERSKTNKLRKNFWAGIKKVIDANISSLDSDEKRRCTPTRRGESSGFVVFKDK